MCRYRFRLAALAAFLLASCGGDRAPSYELTGSTMGTQFSIQVAEPMSGTKRTELQQEIEAVLDTVEHAMSTYLVQSDISKFNASSSTGWVAVSESTCRAVEAAEGVSRLSDGAFDVTVGPLVNLWGFGPDPVRLQPPPDTAVRAALERVGYRRLHADCKQPALKKDSADVYVDLSAYAKGYGVDRVAELLDANGIRQYLVEVGGELRLRGLDSDGELWSVAIETPADTGRGIGRIVRLKDKAMATSGDYRNFFEYEGRRYSHLIDPRTGWPTMHDLAAVTVICDTAALADALATALLVLGPDDGFDLAVREQIAAYFQLRTDNGFVERLTPAFRAIDEPG
ncbi:MAG: FAD:protein FMN transferase [Woeseia sp.]